jgi:hypothetical protein
VDFFRPALENISEDITANWMLAIFIANQTVELEKVKTEKKTQL